MSTTNTIMPSLTADEIANLSNYIFTLNIDTLLDNSTTTRQARNRVNSRPPRPPNAFIMYRRDMAARNITQFTNLKSAEVSRIIGNMWNDEPTQVREVFQSLARLSERRHSEMYRDYRL